MRKFFEIPKNFIFWAEIKNFRIIYQIFNFQKFEKQFAFFKIFKDWKSWKFFKVFNVMKNLMKKKQILPNFSSFFRYFVLKIKLNQSKIE